MLQLVLRLTAQANGTAQMLEALQSIMQPVLWVPGCVRCGLYVDVARPHSICYIEEWSSADEMQRQIRSERFTLLLSLMETAAAPPEMEFRYIGATRGLDLVAELRAGRD